MRMLSNIKDMSHVVLLYLQPCCYVAVFTVLGTPKKKRHKVSSTKTPRHHYSELRKRFKVFFKDGTCPHQSHCEAAMAASKTQNGVIWKLPWANLKKKVNNTIFKQKERKETNSPTKSKKKQNTNTVHQCSLVSGAVLQSSKINLRFEVFEFSMFEVFE